MATEKRLIDANEALLNAPVVHGHWIHKDTGEIRCSECNSSIGTAFADLHYKMIAEENRYCYNCGAKMDLEVHE